MQLVDGLRQGGKGSSIGARGGWARNAFVVAEIALAVVLVVGAGLLARSLAALTAVDMGFSPERLLRAAHRRPGARRSRTRSARRRSIAICCPSCARCRASPSIAGVTSLPTAVGSNGGYWLQGGPRPDQTGVRAPQAIFNVVTPDYFKTIDVPLKSRPRLHGRRSARRARWSRSSTRRWRGSRSPGRDPIGQQIQCGLDTLEFMTIVGVVGRRAHPGTGESRAAGNLHAVRAASGPGDRADAGRAHERARSGGAHRRDPPPDQRAQSRRPGQGVDDGGHARRRRRRRRASRRSC